MYLYDDLAADCESPEPVFGQYPSRLIPKLLPWLRCRRDELLHVCSGSLMEGVRVDVRAAARPTLIADGRALPFRDGSIAAALIDPPYTPHYARDLYGTDYPRPSHLLREVARVVKPCGRLGIVHYITPNPPEGCHLVKVFGLSTGFGFPMRAVTIYEREQSALPMTEAE
jgi:SAM-dependent methyltransferase